jgi:transcriptional regulator with XRE-family HTH domain
MRKLIHLPGRRKRWGLSQADLAQLIGVRQAVVSKYEIGRLTPGARTLMALEIVFGKSGEHLFPSAHRGVEEEVMRRAAALDRTLWGRTDAVSLRKRQLLSRMARSDLTPSRP